jgi:hypothetical protein
MKNDPQGTLKGLAEMGYTHVEHANYVDHKFYGHGQQRNLKKYWMTWAEDAIGAYGT